MAQHSLGVMYDTGEGVLQDYAEAVGWYTRAAEQGYARAQHSLGVMYSEGKGVEQDYAEALRWYRKAADQGNAFAQSDLGGMYYYGKGVLQDYGEAQKLFMKAVERDDGDAQVFLGYMYHKGKGVRQDYAEAMRRYRSAAEQGNALGLNAVGEMYREGQGVKRDYVEAHKWLLLAVSRLPVGKQREEIIKTRNDVAKRLTPAQHSEAKRLARAWRPRIQTASNSRDANTGMKTGWPTTPIPAAFPAGITRIQRDLVELGYDPGIADGVLGPKTRAAILAFQENVGLSVTGEPSEGLEKALRAEKRARAKAQNRYGIAVIIGNKTYKGRTPSVDFAHNDADAMKRFLVERLGFRRGNMIDLRDATKGELEDVFGTSETYKGKLFDWVRAELSDVVVFYSGHGVPGLEDKRGYLLPVDGNPNRARITGYPVDLLYANLAEIEAKSVTVYLDACFSGDSPKGMLVRATSGLVVTPRKPEAASGLVILTAASGDQFASWDEDAKHGLFTLHLLKALRGAADKDKFGNGDGKVTLGEAKKYLDDEMTYQARRLFGRTQTVSVQGEASLVLSTYALGRELKRE